MLKMIITILNLTATSGQFWRKRGGDDLEDACLALYHHETGHNGIDESGILTEAYEAWMASYGARIISWYEAQGASNAVMAAQVNADLAPYVQAGKYARKSLKLAWQFLTDGDIEELKTPAYTKEHLGPKGGEPLIAERGTAPNCYYAGFSLEQNGVSYGLTRNWHDADRAKVAQWVKEKISQNASSVATTSTI